jgi:hypothetical protein
MLLPLLITDISLPLGDYRDGEQDINRGEQDISGRFDRGVSDVENAPRDAEQDVRQDYDNGMPETLLSESFLFTSLKSTCQTLHSMIRDSNTIPGVSDVENAPEAAEGEMSKVAGKIGGMFGGAQRDERDARNDVTGDYDGARNDVDQVGDNLDQSYDQGEQRGEQQGF